MEQERPLIEKPLAQVYGAFYHEVLVPLTDSMVFPALPSEPSTVDIEKIVSEYGPYLTYGANKVVSSIDNAVIKLDFEPVSFLLEHSKRQFHEWRDAYTIFQEENAKAMEALSTTQAKLRAAERAYHMADTDVALSRSKEGVDRSLLENHRMLTLMLFVTEAFKIAPEVLRSHFAEIREKQRARRE